MLRRLLPGVYEGWIVVGSGAFVVLLIAASFFYGFGTIFNEVIDEFGWSVAATSLAFSLRSEVGGVAAPFIGVLIDRKGPGRVLLFGVVLTAIGVALMSFMQAIWQFYVVMLLIAIGTSSAGGQVARRDRGPGSARGARGRCRLMALGGGMGGVLVVGVAWLVEGLGWRWALRVMALAMLTLGLFAAATCAPARAVTRSRSTACGVPTGTPATMTTTARTGACPCARSSARGRSCCCRWR